MIKIHVTIELTNYCPSSCGYCSSNSTTDKSSASFVSVEMVKSFLSNRRYDSIILSGGEPLAHPRFHDILEVCNDHTDDVIVHTNALTHVIYNANVIDGIYVEANLNINDSTNVVRILKRVQCGREKSRPQVTFSKNFESVNCIECNEIVLRPDGTISPSPCRKDERSERLHSRTYTIEKSILQIFNSGLFDKDLINVVRESLNNLENDEPIPVIFNTEESKSEYLKQIEFIWETDDFQLTLLVEDNWQYVFFSNSFVNGKSKEGDGKFDKYTLSKVFQECKSLMSEHDELRT